MTSPGDPSRIVTPSTTNMNARNWRPPPRDRGDVGRVERPVIDEGFRQEIRRPAMAPNRFADPLRSRRRKSPCATRASGVSGSGFIGVSSTHARKRSVRVTGVPSAAVFSSWMNSPVRANAGVYDCPTPAASAASSVTVRRRRPRSTCRSRNTRRSHRSPRCCWRGAAP